MPSSVAPPVRTAPRARAVVGVLALAGGVAQGFGRFGFALLLPAVNADLLHSYAVAGLMGTLNLLAYLAGTATVSATAGRWAPAQLVRSGLLLVTAGLVVLATAPVVAVLGVGMVVTGFGGALIWVPTPGLAGAAVPPGRRGLAIGLAGSGIGVSVLFCSLLTALVHALAGAGAWRQVWAVEAVIALAAWAVAGRVLRVPVAAPAARVRVTALRHTPGWVGLFLSYSLYGLAVSIYMTFLVTALQADGGFSAPHAAAVFAVVGVLVAGGGVLLGRLSDRTGRRGAMVLAYLLMAAGIVLVPLGAEPWAVLSAVAFGLPMSGAPAVTAAHLADHTDPRTFAAAFGAITLGFGVVQLLGPQLGGWIGESSGSFTPAFLLAAAAALGAAAASATLPGGGPVHRPSPDGGPGAVAVPGSPHA